jgi:hypothetical protein
VKITNKHNLPQPLFRAVTWAVEKYEGPRALEALRYRKISVTTLINPPRLTFLRACHEDDLEVDAADLLYLVTGISFHFLMAELADELNEEKLVETRIERNARGWLVSGQFDVLDGARIADWKWTSVWSLVTPKVDWLAQLNVYRWLAKTAGKEVNSLQTWAMLRDWSHSKALADPRLPKIPFAQVEQPIWTDEMVEAYVDDRIGVYESARSMVLNAGHANAAPVCNENERWERKGEPVRCRTYCDVAKYCSFGAALPPPPVSSRRRR